METQTISSASIEILVTTTETTILATPTPTPTPTIPAEDIDMLAGLINAEAGYRAQDQMWAVGQVVINRMNHYNLTLHEVIYQKEEGGYYTFSVVGHFEHIERSPESIDIATQLLSGIRFEPVKDALWFCNTTSYEAKLWHYRASTGPNARLRNVGTFGSTVFFELND